MAAGWHDPLMAKRTFSLRLDEDLAHGLDLVARVEKSTMTEVIRDAATAYLEARRKNPDFRRRLKEIFDADLASFTPDERRDITARA